MEASVGCFIKTLPVLLRAQPELTVGTAIRSARDEILGAWKHLDVSLAAMVHEVEGTERLFDVTFIHDAYPAHPAGVLGTVSTPFATFPGTLTVLVEQIGAESQVVVQYAEPTISTPLATALAEQLVTVFGRVPSAVEQPVGTLFASANERDKSAMAALEDTHYFDAPTSSLAELFVQKCLADPAQIAWSDTEHRYTHAWALDQAESVRRLLDAAPGACGPAVGILMPRSVRLLTGVFGTVLADRPYVPLSLQAPPAVLHDVIDDAEISVVLTLSGIDCELPADVIRINIDQHIDIGAVDRVEPALVAGPTASTASSVLYIEYTSGSTGRPKGVVVQHSGIVNAAADLERRFPLRSGDVYLLKTAFTFDIFGTEAYGWLLGSGTLAVLPEGQEGDPLALLRTIRSTGTTHVNFSPTMLRLTLDTHATGAHPCAPRRRAHVRA
ncbi:MAG: AMP-binding protein [Actinomycetales bacterium]